MPVVTSIKITPTYSYELPFTLSRWLDILIGPIYSCIFIFIFTNKKIQKNEDLTFSLAVGLALGLAFGLVLGLAVGLVLGLAFGLTAGLTAGLATLIKLIFSSRFKNWLLAEDKK
ncbi:MAG: hypothetical protein QMD50_00080 [Patescibacteria group bacterium]|nr:hypothetical protein [Patescibacteria group bacterium]